MWRPRVHLATWICAVLCLSILLFLNIRDGLRSSVVIDLPELHTPLEYGWPLRGAITYSNQVDDDGDIAVVYPRALKIDWAWKLPVDIGTNVSVLSATVFSIEVLSRKLIYRKTPHTC